MRRTILIVLGILFGGTALLALYTVWDYDPDSLSPAVATPSFRSMFDSAVARRTGKSFQGLDEAGRQSLLSELIASHEPDGVREVAIFMTRELGDKNVAFGILRKNIPGLSPDLYEVAIGSLGALSLPSVRGYLDSLYATLDTVAAAHTPLADYRTSTLLVSHAGDDLAATFQERSRLDADYGIAQAAENTLFFPANPAYFIAFPNADDAADALKDSRFMQAMKDSPVPQDIWGIPFIRPAAALRSRMQEKVGFISRFFSPERLIRDNLSVASYGNDYLFVSFKDKNLSLGERLMGVMKTFGKDFGIMESSFDGVDISTVRRGKSGNLLSYATVGPYVVAATDTALLHRAITTYRNRRGTSLGVDPLFNKSYAAVDQSGKKDVMFAWFNPTLYFDVIGADRMAARRLAVLARATGRPLLANRPATLKSVKGTIASLEMSGKDPMQLWRYIVDVRSLRRNTLDSLAGLAGVNIGSQIVPYLGTAMSVSYDGINYLKHGYGYANTGYNVVATIPLRNAPADFDATFGRFLGGVTSLVNRRDSIPGSAATLWAASDTTATDSSLRQQMLQPSFSVVNGQTLVIASTPSLLRTAVADYLAPGSGEAVPADQFFAGRIGVDTLAGNSARYLTTYLLRIDRYPPAEIESRIDPLRKGLALYRELNWKFNVEGGLRHGEALLIAKKM
jgi:hypothetical protein